MSSPNLPHAQGAGDEGRLRSVAGDFFTDAPPGADAYVLKDILHDWTDEQCRTPAAHRQPCSAQPVGQIADQISTATAYTVLAARAIRAQPEISRTTAIGHQVRSTRHPEAM